jgi:PIN domain
VATNYVFIDFENVQPGNLELLQQHPFRVLVFVGASQTKIPFELAAAMQSLGEAGKYIRIVGTGKNALDFHIACYIGELAAKDSGAYFHVISRDTGFDPLITHLNTRGIKVQRQRDLAEIPAIRMSTTISPDDKVAAILKNLAGRGQSRPRKIATLSNTINSLFAGKLSEQQLAGIIQDLAKRKYITLNNTNVSYQLPN